MCSRGLIRGRKHGLQSLDGHSLHQRVQELPTVGGRIFSVLDLQGLGDRRHHERDNERPCSCSCRWGPADCVLDCLVDDLEERLPCHTLVEDRSIVDLTLWASRSSRVSLLELVRLDFLGHRLSARRLVRANVNLPPEHLAPMLKCSRLERSCSIRPTQYFVLCLL
jgi:hypothetical protein